MHAEILFSEHKLRVARLKYLESCLGPERLHEYTGVSIEELEKQRKEQLRQLQLYDAVVAILTEKEQWLVRQIYANELSLSYLTVAKNSPFRDCAKSTIWRYKDRILRKADAFLQSLDIPS